MGTSRKPGRFMLAELWPLPRDHICAVGTEGCHFRCLKEEFAVAEVAALPSMREQYFAQQKLGRNLANVWSGRIAYGANEKVDRQGTADN